MGLEAASFIRVGFATRRRSTSSADIRTLCRRRVGPDLYWMSAARPSEQFVGLPTNTRATSEAQRPSNDKILRLVPLDASTVSGFQALEPRPLPPSFVRAHSSRLGMQYSEGALSLAYFDRCCMRLRTGLIAKIRCEVD